MAQRSREQMYEATGLTDSEREQMIWELWRRRYSYARIAKRIGVSVGAVRASVARTNEKLGYVQPGDWDADLR